jgi:PAS domain S-box-containing protein
VTKDAAFPLSDTFLKLILETSPEAIFVKDRDFKIVLANKSFLSFYPEDMRDRVIGFTTLESYNPEEVKEFLKLDQLAFDEGYSSVNEKINFPNGEELILYTQKVRFEDSEGRPFILGIAQNITERQNLLEELTKSNKELTRANEELAQFSYRASHDLKSPLLTTLGLVDVIKEDLDDKDYDEVRNNLERIKEHTGQLEDLVNDILNLTMADHSEEEVEEVNLKSILNSIVLKLEGLFKSKGVELVVEVPEEFSLKVCKVRLNQVLENLISNAIKYSSLERKGFIRIENYTTDCGFLIKVSDNGKGIDLKYQEQVFSMFKRFHPNAATGSGLGLYLVKKHVEAMNGQITFESSPSGTSFKILLPKL